MRMEYRWTQPVKTQTETHKLVKRVTFRVNAPPWQLLSLVIFEIKSNLIWHTVRLSTRLIRMCTGIMGTVSFSLEFYYFVFFFLHFRDLKIPYEFRSVLYSPGKRGARRDARQQDVGKSPGNTNCLRRTMPITPHLHVKNKTKQSTFERNVQ